MTETYTYDPLPGTRIGDAAIKMVELAPCECYFNGIRIVSTVGMAPGDIEAEYWRKSEERVREYRESPEGIRDALDAEARRSESQAVLDWELALLPSLDLGDLGAVIAWLERVTPHMGLVGVTFDREAVVTLFMLSGYEPVVNCYDDFRPDDRDNVAIWIIGQALSGIIRVGSPHNTIHRFAEEWRSTFDDVGQH